MKVFFLTVVALYILYLIFLVVRACSELKNMPYSGITAYHTAVLDASQFFLLMKHWCAFCFPSLDLRLRFLTALTFVVLIIRCVFKKIQNLWIPSFIFSKSPLWLIWLNSILLFFLPSLPQHGHSLPEVWCQGSPRQFCGWVVYSLPKLYPFKWCFISALISLKCAVWEGTFMP